MCLCGTTTIFIVPTTFCPFPSSTYQQLKMERKRTPKMCNHFLILLLQNTKIYYSLFYPKGRVNPKCPCTRAATVHVLLLVFWAFFSSSPVLIPLKRSQPHHLHRNSKQRKMKKMLLFDVVNFIYYIP